MRLSSPKKITWFISAILALLAINVNWVITITFLSPYAFIILLVAFIILWLGTFLKGF
ncbi:MAG: hypothetical protein ACOY90_13880 [Candidatus Zhuqueibacterota bacterium]